jgi:hypothetical protein
LYIFPDGKAYAGRFFNGARFGKGTCSWASGKKCAGECNGSEFSSWGIMIMPDGRRYAGELENKDWKFHGQGTLFDRNGRILQKGSWENDRFVGER